MATKKKQDKGSYPGIQAIYDANGFGGLWKYAHGHSIKRWIKLRNWSRKRVAQAKDPTGFKKELELDQKKIAHLRKLKHAHKPDGKLVVVFDDRPVPAWIAHLLTQARATGVWHGTCISGVRTVEESIGLCVAMCGQSSCPGRCAGAATNHTCPPTHQCSYPEGAVDCTDPAGLAAALRSIGNTTLIGDGRVLPADINHFSHAGN